MTSTGKVKYTKVRKDDDQGTKVRSDTDGLPRTEEAESDEDLIAKLEAIKDDDVPQKKAVEMEKKTKEKANPKQPFDPPWVRVVKQRPHSTMGGAPLAPIRVPPRELTPPIRVAPRPPPIRVLWRPHLNIDP